MLEVERKKTLDKKDFSKKEIIVKRKTPIIEYKDDKKIEYNKVTKVNLTKKMNETKKLIKADSATEKLAELERIFSK